MRKNFAAFAAVLALSCPAWATVLGPGSPAVYTCNGSTTAFTIPWPYLSPSQVVATQTTGGVTTTVTGTVKPTVAPSTGTLTLGVACPNGSTLTITRNVPVTQPQSFRTGSYQGATHEQAFDRVVMEAQDTKTAQTARDNAQDTTTAANLAAAVATQATRDTGQDTAIVGVNNNVAALNGTSHTVTDTSSVLAFGASTPRTLTSRFGERLTVKDFGATGDGVTDDSAAILAACNATTGRRLFLEKATYRIGTTMSCAAKMLWFEAGAQLSIDAARSFTAQNHVVSLGGDPAIGSGAMIYGNDTNMFANDVGFSFSKTPSVGTDDFFHIRRDIQGSTGIIIRNDDDIGTLTDGYVHIYGGPLTGPTQGSNLRLSAGNKANNNGLVNIVAQNDAAFSLIQAAAAPIDFYTANVPQFEIASVVNAKNIWQFKGGAAGSSISLSPAGTTSDANVSIVYNTKGTGSHFFRTGVTPAFQFEVKDTAGAVNRAVVTGSVAGNPTISTTGGGITLDPVGSIVKLNNTTALQLGSVTFATLPAAPTNGMMIYCSDCGIAATCAGAGTGAIAKRIAGGWVCN